MGADSPTTDAMAEKGEASRQHIIETANRLFYQRGYNQTSFSDIAEAAAIPRGNFYYHFKTKDDILVAVVEHRIAYYRDMLVAWEAEHSEPRQRLKRFIQMMRGNAKDLVRYGCPVGSLNIEIGKAQLELKTKTKKLFDLFRDWLAAQFREIGRKDASSLALHFLGRAQGISVMSQAYGDRKYLKEELDDLETWLERQVSSRK